MSGLNPEDLGCDPYRARKGATAGSRQSQTAPSQGTRPSPKKTDSKGKPSSFIPRGGSKRRSQSALPKTGPKTTIASASDLDPSMEFDEDSQETATQMLISKYWVDRNFHVLTLEVINPGPNPSIWLNKEVSTIRPIQLVAMNDKVIRIEVKRTVFDEIVKVADELESKGWTLKNKVAVELGHGLEAFG